VRFLSFICFSVLVLPGICALERDPFATERRPVTPVKGLHCALTHPFISRALLC
jgi:hypothetical protein